MPGVRVETEKIFSRHTDALRACDAHALRAKISLRRFAHCYVNPILRQKTAVVLQSREVLKIGRIITDK